MPALDALSEKFSAKWHYVTNFFFNLALVGVISIIFLSEFFLNVFTVMKKLLKSMLECK